MKVLFKSGDLLNVNQETANQISKKLNSGGAAQWQTFEFGTDGQTRLMINLCEVSCFYDENNFSLAKKEKEQYSGSI